MTHKRFIALLDSDNGPALTATNATSAEHARKNICIVEGCPDRAILHLYEDTSAGDTDTPIFIAFFCTRNGYTDELEKVASYCGLNPEKAFEVYHEANRSLSAEGELQIWKNGACIATFSA